MNAFMSKAIKYRPIEWSKRQKKQHINLNEV